MSFFLEAKREEVLLMSVTCRARDMRLAFCALSQFLSARSVGPVSF